MKLRCTVCVLLIAVGCSDPSAITPDSLAAVDEVVAARLNLASVLERALEVDGFERVRDEVEQAFADLDQAEGRLAAVAKHERIAVQKKCQDELNAALDAVNTQRERVVESARAAEFVREAATASRGRPRRGRNRPPVKANEPAERNPAREEADPES